MAKKATDKKEVYVLISGKHAIPTPDPAGGPLIVRTYTRGEELELTEEEVKGLTNKVRPKNAIDAEVQAAQAAGNAKQLAEENSSLRDQLAAVQLEIEALKSGK